MDFFTNAGCKVVDATIATDPVSGAVKGATTLADGMFSESSKM